MSDQAQNNINDILDNIKEVITTGKAPSEDGDVLVLTERVDAGNSSPAAPQNSNQPEPKKESTEESDFADDMASLMAQMAKQTESKPELPVESTPAPQATVAQENNDDMAALMAQMSKQPEPEAQNNVEATQPSEPILTTEEKDILEKIDEDAGAAIPVNQQKSLTSQDFSAPAFNQLKDNEKVDNLLSEQVAIKSMEKLKSLVDQLEPKPNKAESPSFRAGVTLEDLVMEAMKPEISKWLNDNLPQLVTSIVEKEIKKIIPR